MGTKIVITTIGTSLINNFLEKDKKDKKVLRELANEEKKEKPVSQNREDYEIFKSQLKRNSVFNKLKEFALKNFPKSSAELTSLQKLKEKYPNDDFVIYLLTSDTFEGYFVGEILKEVLEEKGYNIKFLRPIEKLRVFKTSEYLEGINNLINMIKGIYQNERKGRNLKTTDFIFNITGGYKAIIPYITTNAFLNRNLICYIFENTKNKENENHLIELNPLPIGIDDIYIENIYWSLKSLKEGESINDNDKEILEKFSLVYKSGEKYHISALGELVFYYIEQKTSISYRNVLSKLVELLIFKYLINEYPQSLVRHSIQQNGSEIVDLLVEDNNALHLGEVKALFTALKKVNNNYCGNQISKIKNIPLYKDKKIKSYTLYIFTFYDSYQDAKENNKNLKDLNNEISAYFQKKGIDFSLKILNFSDLLKKENPTQALLDVEIEEYIQEYKGG